MRRKRGTFAKQRQPFVPQINVRITEEQLSWLSSQVKPFRNKSAVIRDLIDSRIEPLTEVSILSAYDVGAGAPQGSLRPPTGDKPSLKQPGSAEETAKQQQLLPHPTEAVQSSAQELEPKKNKNPKKSKKTRAKRTKGSVEFEAFWKRYQGCKHRVNSQNKPDALTVWEQLVPDEISADDLMRALAAAIDDIQSRQGISQFASQLPSCHRWLRDGYYCTYLEDNAPEPTKSSMFL